MEEAPPAKDPEESAAEAPGDDPSMRETEPSAPAPEPEPPRPRDEILELADEIDQAEPFLEYEPSRRRSAQIRAWAGRARQFQDLQERDPRTPIDRKKLLRGVFGRLTRITRELPCGWVEALSPDWKTDWDVYVAMARGQLGGKFAPITKEQERAYFRDLLEALFNPRRRVDPSDAHELVREASEALAPTEPLLAKATQMFGAPPPLGPRPERDTKRQTRRVEDRDETPAPSREVPAAVLAATRGKRAVIAGGQGAREEHRREIEKALELASLEWVFGERGQSSQFQRLEERAHTGRYDLFFFLSGFTSHKSNDMLREYKAAGVPVVYVTRGYSISSIAHAIEEQLVQKARAAD